jgi:hypothetical protein
MFARASLYLLNEKKSNPGWTVVHVETGVEAVEKLKNESFDLVISTLIYPGIPDPMGKVSSRAGGVDLYQFVIEKNATICADEKIAFCFLTRSERHIARDYLERRGLQAPPIYGKGTPLHEIIEVIEREKRAAKSTAPHLPEKKTAEEKNNPSAVIKELRL